MGGRLSEDEIERMVKEAEQFAEEDKKKAGDKISEEDKASILEAVEEGIKRVDGNPNADEDAYKEKQKEIEEVCNPIISKLYQGAEGGAPGGPGGEGGAGEEEEAPPSHEEL